MSAKTVIQLVLKAKDQASSVLKSTAAKVTALVTALAGGVAIKNTVEQMGLLDVAAKRLGVTMEELTSAQYAAFQGGNVTPDRFVNAMDDMRIKIEEFNQTGSGGAADFFEILNLQVEDFHELNPVDQLLKISEAMEHLGDSSQFTFLDQMGSDSLRDLQPILKNGGQEFKRLQEEARKFNLTLTDADTIVITQLQSSFTRLRKVGTTAFSKIVASAAPEISSLADTFTEMIVGVSDDAEKPISKIGGYFSSLLSGILKVIGFTGRVKDAFDVAFSAVGSIVLFFTELFLTGIDTIDKSAVKFGNGFVNVFRKAISKVMNWFNKRFITPLLTFARVFNLDGIASSLSDFQKKVTGFRDDLNKPVEMFNRHSMDPLLETVREARKKLHQMGMENVEQVFNSDLVKDLEKFEKKYEENLTKNRDKMNDEIKNRREKSEDKTLASLQTKNAEAAAKIAETRANLLADQARLEIEHAIRTIETLSQIEIQGLAERARIENLSATQIGDMRLQIELDASKRISDERKKLIDQDIKVLKASLKAQKDVLAATANKNDQATLTADIAAIESEITLKRSEQAAIGQELVLQSLLLQAGRKAEAGQLKERLDDLREDAEIQLKIVRGDHFGAELDKIEREFRDTLRDLEDLGEDSTAIQKLIDSKKATAEMDEIERQFVLLKDKLEKYEINPFKYMSEIEALGGRGMDLAESTGDPQKIRGMIQLLQEARSEVFDLNDTFQTLGETLESSLGDAFLNILDGTKTISEAFGDMATSVLQEIAKIISQLLAQLAVQMMLNSMGWGGASMGGGGGFSSILSGLGLNHSGNEMGKSVIQRTGSVGLRSDEALIIGKKGEEVLTETDPRHRKNRGKSESGGSSTPVVVNNMIDSPSVAKAMEGSDGERVIMNIIRANRGEIKSL